MDLPTHSVLTAAVDGISLSSLLPLDLLHILLSTVAPTLKLQL